MGYIDHHTAAARKGLIDGSITSPAVTKCPVSNSWDKRSQLRQCYLKECPGMGGAVQGDSVLESKEFR